MEWKWCRINFELVFSKQEEIFKRNHRMYPAVYFSPQDHSFNKQLKQTLWVDLSKSCIPYLCYIVQCQWHLSDRVLLLYHLDNAGRKVCLSHFGRIHTHSLHSYQFPNGQMYQLSSSYLQQHTQKKLCKLILVLQVIKSQSVIQSGLWKKQQQKQWKTYKNSQQPPCPSLSHCKTVWYPGESTFPVPQAWANSFYHNAVSFQQDLVSVRCVPPVFVCKSPVLFKSAKDLINE